jgi:hypothetical protein
MGSFILVKKNVYRISSKQEESETKVFRRDGGVLTVGVFRSDFKRG